MRAGKEWLAVTQHDRVVVVTTLVDEAEIGQDLRDHRAGDVNLSAVACLETARHRLDVA